MNGAARTPGDQAADRLRAARAALSELFLDREFDDADRRRLCEALAATGLDLATLERVFTEELEPLLSANLRTPAGEWAGFDIDWLEARIRERQGQQDGWRRWWQRGRQALAGRSPAHEEWLRLRELLVARAGSERG
ncbi:hypothetical protein IS481_07780 [Caldimonas thermodepolymerans]|uniref:DUF7079 domain-containing protein n=1 Tax=Caldimonas thermodepolymerans TaxID=215580 RepID=A0A2S5T734_9BURK|nr:hypothetical protein [Caldimonas thermodepolymerans]PPE70813.1 hypothetical protein C1702_04545 [Caldimonas thermodepolymerans]QPC33031.1 hypothetical protein IS481_07780 [Caldimonas thermodepolymerans]RDI03817.1 hypothetical protein DES46_101505 [Caldimonas thermodepolymerans]TCP09784.1 hypothetical protein EV676_101363 [Caldimonas thermodepolymerans]UZG45900.1 hypothetical protein ONZ46_08130 [Caldimonas thermodepolymerans]